MNNYESIYSLIKQVKPKYEGEMDGVYIEIPGDSNVERPSIKYHYWASEIINNKIKYFDILNKFHQVFFGNSFILPEIKIYSLKFIDSNNPPEFRLSFKSGYSDPYFNQCAVFSGLDNIIHIEMNME